MSGWYLDTSVLVAATVAQHPHNSRAMAVLEEAEKTGVRLFAAAHGLLEAYSVLTRTPFRPAIYPAEAGRMLESLMSSAFHLVALDGAEYREVVASCAESGETGGRVFDALQVRCAMKSGCDRVYTFNTKEFQRLMTGDWRSRVCLP